MTQTPVACSKANCSIDSYNVAILHRGGRLVKTRARSFGSEGVAGAQVVRRDVVPAEKDNDCLRCQEKLCHSCLVATKWRHVLLVS